MEPKPRPHRRARRRQLASLTSGFVAALALGTSFYNVYLQRRQIEAQVWPHLEFLHSNTGGEFSLNLYNTGVGPAKIRGVWLKVAGKPMKDWDEALKEILKGDPALDALVSHHDVSMSQSTVTERVVAPGSQIQALRLYPTPQDAGVVPDLSSLPSLFHDVSFEICYCSTLDDCEMMRTRKSVPKCPSDPTGQFFN